MLISPIRPNIIHKNNIQNEKIKFTKSPISFSARTLAITGNIASGKSTVQKIFEQNAIPCLDVDNVVKDLYLKDENLINEVKNLFWDYGINSLENDNFIDKTKIRTIVFQDKNLRTDLEKIVHPAVGKIVQNFIEKNKNNKNVAIFNPLLFEKNNTKDYDYVVLIKITPEEQLKRLLARNSFLTPKTAQERINSMMPQFLKENRADFVVDNSGNLENTQKQVKELVKKLNGDFSPQNNSLFIGLPFLKYNWQKIMKQMGIDEKTTQKEFSNFLNAYDNKSRNYHGIKHVEKMLKELNEFEKKYPGKIKNPKTLNFGVFMHDFVNGSKNDVEDSLKVALNILKKSNNTEFKSKNELLSEIILATKHNKPVADDSSLEAKIIADIDLAILGSDKNNYDLYAKQIRHEYSQYPDKIFAEGRIAVLETFLNRNQIYVTDYFNNKYEARARKNIQNEISFLNKFE